MAKQKAVIKLEVNGERPASIAKKMGVGTLKVIMPFQCISEKFKHTPCKNKSKARQIAAGLPGVDLVGLEGEGNDELVVKGVFDPVKLVAELRKKVGGASIKSVGPEEEKKNGKNNKSPENLVVHSYYPPPLVYVEVLDDYHYRGCFS